MQLRTKILLPLIVLLITFSGLSFYSWTYFSRVKVQVNEEIVRAEKEHDLLERIGILREQARNYVMLYWITKDEEYVILGKQNSDRISELLDQVKPLTTTEVGKAFLAEFERARSGVRRERGLLVEAVRNNNQEEIERRSVTWDIYSDMSGAAISDYMSYSLRNLESADDYYEDLMNKVFAFQGLMTLFMSGLIGLLYFYLRNIISVPLKNLSKMARGISKGVFGSEYLWRSSDEIGALSQDLMVMSEKLKKSQATMKADVERKEEELRKLKEFESQKDIFISTASHELKTPVTSLKIFEQLLKKEVINNGHAQYINYLERMEGQVDKLSRLTTSLLEVARWQVGKISVNMNTFDLEKCVKDSVYIAQKNTRKHKILIKGKARREVRGDPDRISQVIDNLLSNAIKYSPNGKKIVVTMGQDDNCAIVRIKDHGIGIDREDQRKIFRRYYRVAGKDENTFPGMGIGLYVCREIIKRHKGRLWVESSRGGGSTFCFTLPYAD